MIDVLIAILNLVYLLILYFLICPFLFSLLWFDGFLSYYVCVLFLVFMNLLYVSDLWLPCFSSVLTPSCIHLLQTGNNIGSNIFWGKNVHFLTLLPYILWFWGPPLHLHVYPFTVQYSYQLYINKKVEKKNSYQIFIFSYPGVSKRLLTWFFSKQIKTLIF